MIELKRNQTADQTVGRILRYMGWIKKHLAKEAGKTVEGLIIAHAVDKRLPYALSLLPQVSMMTYEMEFRLKHCEALPE